MPWYGYVGIALGWFCAGAIVALYLGQTLKRLK